MRAVVLALALGLAALGALTTVVFLRDSGPGPVEEGAVPPAQPGATEPERDAPEAPAPLRALLLRPDMATPAPAGELRVYSFVPRSMELPEFVRAVRTGADGIADCTGLAPGSYVVCAPGATPRAAAPRTARATVGAGETVLVRLVEAAPATVVRFDVRASFTPRFGVTSKLVLRRVDDGSGDLFQQPDLLKPGAVTFELALPPGRYAVGTLPLGELVVEPGSRELVVGEEERTATIVLTENPARVDVVLEGVPATELPARVYPQSAADSLLADRPAQLWWGPPRWHRPDLQAPALEGPRRVLVFGRNATFRSRDIVTLDSDRVAVALEPAARVVVDWFDWDPARDAGAVLTVEVGEEVVARTLVPRFGEGHPELERPAMGGEVVVAHGGEARLECRRPDGTLAWERTVALIDDPVRVRIE